LQHAIGPHGIDVNPGANGPLQAIGVSPGVGTASDVEIITHVPHYDRMSLTVAPSGTSGQSTITITGEHFDAAVPEPGTLALGSLGASVLFVARRLRRRIA
jgi:hypothetical protein